MNNDDYHAPLDDWDNLPKEKPRAQAGGDGWEKPITFDDVELPIFPIDTLPEVLRDYCLAVAEACQVPVDMPAMSALGILATALQTKFQIKANSDWSEPLNLFLMFVANPSDMKSPTMKKFTNAIISFEAHFNKENRDKINNSRDERERLEKRLAAAKSKKDSMQSEVEQARKELTAHEDFPPLQLMADDTTVESLSKLMQENNGRMAVISSEAGIFAALKGRYTEGGGVHIDIFLKSYNGLTDFIRINRISREPVDIPNPALTVLLAAQPQILRELMGETAFRGRGFHGRFLYSYPKSKVGSRKVDGIKPISEQLKTEYASFIHSLLEIDNKEAVVLTLSNEASRLLVQFRQWIEPQLIEELEFISDWAGKLHGQILRIAGLLHVASSSIYTTPFAADNPPVTAQTMENAITIGKYFLEHALYCFGEMAEDAKISNARYLLRKIKSIKSLQIGKRGLIRAVQGKQNFNLDESLNVLVERNYIRIDKANTGTAGRPSETIILNPEA